MRITGPNGTALASVRTSTRPAASGTFTLSEQEPSRSTGAAGSLRAVAPLDALLALQGVDDFTQRKKRAVAKGRHALDALDALKVALLDGTVDRGTLARLKLAAEGLTAATGDARIDAVMLEIDLRLAVELAKVGAS
jgi:hypothetical protein